MAAAPGRKSKQLEWLFSRDDRRARSTLRRMPRPEADNVARSRATRGMETETWSDTEFQMRQELAGVLARQELGRGEFQQ
jgi:hypothetical protein